MLTRFHKFIDENQLINENENILLGVSGGIDSIVMLDLMARAGFDFAVAHCNFKLRGKESDDDETFVRNLANDYKVPFYHIAFNTKENALERGISIQMAARNLRLAWFGELSKTYGYDKIALAHHRDDEVESFFINLSRGTGIRGLTGMKEKNRAIIRPLLFASRNDILDYCNKNKLTYREDSSNRSQEYYRNKIRLSIIPVFNELNPRFTANMIENIDRLRQVEDIYKQSIAIAFDQCVKQKGNEIHIHIAALQKLKPLSTYLFEFIREFGFSNNDLPEIIRSLDGLSGKMFYSSSHRIVKDRNALIITNLKSNGSRVYYIEKDVDHINEPISIQFKRKRKQDLHEIEKNPDIAYIDLDLLNFPLILRLWKKGEYFMPFGMNNLKKLSDFFIDQKMSVIEKEKTWILASDENPVWIVGHRIDNRYRISEKTKNILIVTLLKKP